MRNKSGAIDSIDTIESMGDAIDVTQVIHWTDKQQHFEELSEKKGITMERSKGFCLTGAILALGLATLSAGAQDKSMRTDNTAQMNMNRYDSMRSDWKWDSTLPASPAQNHMMLLQSMADKNFGKSDIVKILPLLEDLCNAENMYKFGMDGMSNRWAMMHDQSKMNGGDAFRTASQTFRDKREGIWNAISSAVGPDKTWALRSLVEPMKENVSTYKYTSSHLQRIDQLLRDWDRMAAERMAANPNSGNNTASTVSVETTTTTTTIPGIEVYSIPALTTQEVVDILQMRLAALEGFGAPESVLAMRGHELTSPNMRFLRDKSLRYWD